MVEALQEHPRDPNQILIGYSRGLVVIWDLQGSQVITHFLSSQVGAVWKGGSPRLSSLALGACLGGWLSQAQVQAAVPSPAPHLFLSSCKATGECQLAAGWLPDCHLPLRRQPLPVARVQ